MYFIFIIKYTYIHIFVTINWSLGADDLEKKNMQKGEDVKTRNFLPHDLLQLCTVYIYCHAKKLYSISNSILAKSLKCSLHNLFPLSFQNYRMFQRTTSQYLYLHNISKFIGCSEGTIKLQHIFMTLRQHPPSNPYT